MRAKPKFRQRSRGRASGAQIGAKAVTTWLCESCNGFIHRGNKRDLPTQCRSCGSLSFIAFDSSLEANRWGQLMLLFKAGHVADLKRQKRIDLLAHREGFGAVRVGVYIADFTYTDLREGGAYVVEDVKPDVMTPEAAWKLRHFEAQFGFPVKIVTP